LPRRPRDPRLCASDRPPTAAGEVRGEVWRRSGLFHEDGMRDPEFTDLLTLDLRTVEASLAGPRRPQDRVPLKEVKSSLEQAFGEQFPSGRKAKERMDWESAASGETARPPADAAPVDPRPKSAVVALSGHT